jgi:hypothetical protein
VLRNLLAAALAACSFGDTSDAQIASPNPFNIGPSASTSVGLPVGGIALSLVAQESALRAKSAWSATLEVRNVTAFEQIVEGPVLACAFEFVFRKQTSQKIVVANPSNNCDVYWVGGEHITAGNSIYVRAAFTPYDLDFLTDGTWYVWARANLPVNYEPGTPRRFITSNGITLRVFAGASLPTKVRGIQLVVTPRT